MNSTPGDEPTAPGGGSADDATVVVDPQPTPPHASDAGRSRKRRWPKVLGIIALVLILIAGLALAGLWYIAKHFEGNVSTIKGFVADAPAESYEPVNFLLMGSDFRGDGNSVEGETEEMAGQRSDTTMLVHVSADRDRALVVSIPRDTLLELPECAAASGQWRPTDKFNSAFAFGGPTCTVQTVEELTGVTIHHAAVIDFLGFKQVVDALGGVEVCLEEAVDDPDSGLNLPAGVSKVSGDQALAFVRARKNIGDGSDVSRIQRQQQFMSSAIRQATDAQLLLKPVTLYKMLDAATASLTVDSGLDDVDEMAAMAASLRNLRPSNITFVTMPFTYNDDFSTVSVDTKAADEIWQAIIEDQPWPTPVPEGAADLTVAPQDIAVLVSNGNGKDNAANEAAADLAESGFVIAGLSVADASTYPNSVVVHNPADAEAARTLQAAVPGAVLRIDPQAPVGQLQLIVGADYAGTVAVSVAGQPADPGASTPAPVTADQSICSS
jgi:LCP family protein required for cell wall assembly